MNGQVFYFLGCSILIAVLLRKTHAYDHSCVDNNSNCNHWAREGYCSTSHDVRNTCRFSCRRCSSSSGSSTTTFSESSECLHDSNYNHLKSLIGDSCSPMDDQWYYLYHLTTSNHPHCARDAAKYLRDYYQAHPAGSNCVCSSSNTVLTHTEHTDKVTHCRGTDDNYLDIYGTTFYPSKSSTDARMCTRHVEEWGKLAAISESSCFNDLVEQFHDKFFSHNPDRRCTCEKTNGGSGGGTSHHTTHSCLQYSAYQDLNAMIEHDTCMSHYEVWGYLNNLSGHSTSCRIAIIDKLNNAYGHFSHTPSNCTCSTHFDPLKLYNDPHGSLPHCMHNGNYNSLVSHLADSSHQVCSSHHTVWKGLAQIPHYTNSNYALCQKDAISHLAVSVSHATHKCSCSPVSVSVATSTIPTTLPPSSVATVPDVKMCSPLSLTVGLAYGAIVKEGNFTCSDGSHALSEAAPMKLCNATDSSNWIKGQQVIPNCDSIPKYSAIASFAGPVYTHDGLAGVFLGCNGTHMTIASEDCTHGLSLFYIPVDSRDSYIHSARNYYTLKW
ncbi:uncharacterized protein LOC117318013 [Pecten maximus]|uniref:uncharacterized protein LOC117318013 n=1 Tax=Pecten maximus TaxID=6579 RepID=UPI001458DC8C|nr:uncharacterized protein LOC117318013 [Pecten maximus]